MKADGESWRTIVRRLPDGARLQVAARLEPLEDRERRLRLVVLAALVGALLATAFVTRALARLALAPLERLRGTAGEVAETADLSRRVPAGEGPEEVDALAGDLNAMLERLEETADGPRGRAGERAAVRRRRRARAAHAADEPGDEPRDRLGRRRAPRRRPPHRARRAAAGARARRGRPARAASRTWTSASWPTRWCSARARATRRSGCGWRPPRSGRSCAARPRACACCSTTSSRTPRCTGGRTARSS